MIVGLTYSSTPVISAWYFARKVKINRVDNLFNMTML